MGSFFSTLAGQRVAFIGAGVAHRDLIPLFAKAGARVTLCDQKPRAHFGAWADEMEALGVALCLGEGYLAGLAGQQMIMRTPGFEYFTPALQAAKAEGAIITSEIELFFEHCPCPIVGVTGSDGKTTTTSLIAAIYAVAGRTVHLGGNIGRALLPIVDDVKKTDVAAVELSSFQLISMHTSPGIAVVTNVTPNHLDHHRDMDEYVNAKRNILRFQPKTGVAVLGHENDISRGMAADALGEVRFFSRLRPVENGAFLNDEGQLCLAWAGRVQPVFHRSALLLRGEHNIENMLAAMAALRDEVTPSAMEKVAQSFAGVAHRIEPVRLLDGVQWFNDSIATSPTRVVAGLRAFSQKLIVIAGGYDKNIPYEPMAKDVLAHVKVLILTGQTADKIEAAVRGEAGFAESGLVILRARDLEDAVHLAHKAARPGDIVTLSPASASFDCYANFEARGEHFKQLVRAL
ncbi:MAG: UDP-N-acetylmuramoyl-L-alanine--D-glutamate ligase [Oscillospiraceae bacterium]